MNGNEKKLRHNAYMRGWKKRNKAKVNAINRRVKAKKPDLYRKINRLSIAKKRAENPERFSAMYHRHRAENPREYLVNHARIRAKKLNLAFNLTADDIVIPEFCPVLGMRLEWTRKQRAAANRSSPSIDRIVPQLGYVRGNIKIISNRANHLKNNATPDELIRVANYALNETRRVEMELAG